MAGLGQLGMLTAQTCPKGLVHEVEHILQVGLCCRQCLLCETKQVLHYVCMTAHVALLATRFAIQYTQSDMLLSVQKFWPVKVRQIDAIECKGCYVQS